jgi:hypothetical protein
VEALADGVTYKTMRRLRSQTLRFPPAAQSSECESVGGPVACSNADGTHIGPLVGGKGFGSQSDFAGSVGSVLVVQLVLAAYSALERISLGCELYGRR